MASSGGHWKDLTEAQKLTQSTKIPGVIEEDVKLNNPITRLPVAQAAGTGLKIEWLRENTTVENAVIEAGVGDQLTWNEDVEYTEVESTLRYLYVQRKLDRYVQNIYGTYNDYKVQALLECEKGLLRRVGDRIIYADTTYGGSPTQMDGLHALAAERGTPNAAATTTYSDLNIDAETGALPLSLVRRMVNAMKFGIDEFWFPPQIAIRLDAAYGEYGFRTDTGETLQTIVHGDISLLTRGVNQLGMPVLYFMGIPIIRTDFLKAEADGTGTGATSNARGAWSSSTKCYSIFGIKRGNVMNREPGLCYAWGGTEGAGDMYELWTWDRLEDYNAGGLRLDHYSTVLLGSTKCLARIFDITDAQVTA